MKKKILKRRLSEKSGKGREARKGLRKIITSSTKSFSIVGGRGLGLTILSRVNSAKMAAISAMNLM